MVHASGGRLAPRREAATFQHQGSIYFVYSHASPLRTSSTFLKHTCPGARHIFTFTPRLGLAAGRGVGGTCACGYLTHNYFEYITPCGRSFMDLGVAASLRSSGCPLSVSVFLSLSLSLARTHTVNRRPIHLLSLLSPTARTTRLPVGAALSTRADGPPTSSFHPTAERDADASVQVGAETWPL